MRNIWKPYEDEFKALYPVLPMAELVKKFPFGASSIKSHASKLKLTKKGKLFSWAYADELSLTALYPHQTNASLAVLFGKTEGAISGAAFKLGLKKTPEFMRAHSGKTFFKPGQTPPNKGKKQSEYMSADAIERSAKTRFKKGQQPHNCYHQVGKITQRCDNSGRPYLYICVAIGTWELYHRYIWQQANGPIPPKHCLWFKDGNSTNCELQNLECITRKENRLRNTAHQTLSDKYLARCIVGRTGNPEGLEQHPELLQLKKQQILLNRKIKQNGKQQTSKP